MTTLAFPSRPSLPAREQHADPAMAADAVRAMVAASREALRLAEAEVAAGQCEIAAVEAAAPPGLAAQLSDIAAAVRDAGTGVQAPAKYTVALMGRTQAGKSTLMAALTGASEEAIGWPGRQRHTRTVTAQEMTDLPGVELIDTPGVGALDGPEDRALALAQLDRAQVVVWVTPNDGFQEDTAESLRLVAGLGKPVIVVLNSKADLRHSINLEEFLNNPGRMLAASEGHLDAVGRHLRQVGAEPLTEIVLHAQAAFFGTRESDHAPLLDDRAREALVAASGIRRLLEVLEREVRAEPRKVLAVAHSGRLHLSNVQGSLEAGAARLEAVAGITADKASEVQKRQTRVVDEAQDRMLAAVRSKVSARRGWVEDLSLDQLRKESNSLWQKAQEQLEEEIRDALQQEAGRLAEELQSTLDDVAAEFDRLSYSTIDPPDFREAWLNRLVKLGGKATLLLGGAALGGTIGMLLGGPLGSAAIPGLGTVSGAVVGKFVGAAVGGFVANPQSRLVDRVGDVFRSEGTILARYRERLRPETDRVFDEYQAANEHQVHALVAKVRGDVDRANRANDDRVRGLRDCAGALNTGAARVWAAIADFDADTAVHTLAAAGRRIDRADILDASRCPGQGTVLRVREPAFTDLALIPAATPEPIVPVSASAASPAADTAQLLLGLTSDALRVEGRDGCVAATIHGMVSSSARRQVWEELAQTITGAPVSIAAEERASTWAGKERDEDKPLAA